MIRQYRRLWVLAFLPSLVIFPLAACSYDEVDPALVGTWQLQWPGQPIYWEIRASGTYELSGPGAAVAHSGSFRAAASEWSLSSATWGDDRGSYQLPNPNTFIGVGKLGPGTWVRAPNRDAEKSAENKIDLLAQQDGSRLLPKDIPELMHRATRRARLWRKDAIPVSLEFNHRDFWNYKGPEIRFSFFSPSEGTGLFLTAATNGVHAHEFNRAVNWGAVSLPPVFVDLPAAVRIARKNGLSGPIKTASLRVWSPGGAPPVLAWMIHTGSLGGGRAVNGATGEIIDYDVTGYIAEYNAQWERAARGLRALLQSARAHPSSNDFPLNGGGSSSSSASSNTSDDGTSNEDYQRSVAEDRAYWGGSAEDYNRIKNGECTWSDSSKYGC